MLALRHSIPPAPENVIPPPPITALAATGGNVPFYRSRITLLPDIAPTPKDSLPTISVWIVGRNPLAPNVRRLRLWMIGIAAQHRRPPRVHIVPPGTSLRPPDLTHHPLLDPHYRRYRTTPKLIQPLAGTGNERAPSLHQLKPQFQLPPAQFLALGVARLRRAESVAAFSDNPALFLSIGRWSNFRLRFAAELDHLLLALKRQLFLSAPARPLDLLLGLGALNIKGPMVYPLRPPCPLKSYVRIPRPGLAPTHKQVWRIPTAILFAEPLAGQLAHRQHDMRMGLTVTITGLTLVNGHIRDHTAIDKLALHKPTQQLQPLAPIELTRQRHFDLAGKLRITPLLDRLDRVPELVAVAHPVGCILGGHDLGMHNATLAAVVVLQSLAIIPQPPSRPVGGGCDR